MKLYSYKLYHDIPILGMVNEPSIHRDFQNAGWIKTMAAMAPSRCFRISLDTCKWQGYRIVANRMPGSDGVE